MDFVADAALRVWLRNLLIRVARARVPDEAVGVRLRFWRGGRLRGCTLEGRGEAAQSVRSDSDRSFGFWPRTMSRGSACAGGAAQAVASLGDFIFGETEEALASLRDA